MRLELWSTTASSTGRPSPDALELAAPTARAGGPPPPARLAPIPDPEQPVPPRRRPEVIEHRAPPQSRRAGHPERCILERGRTGDRSFGALLRRVRARQLDAGAVDRSVG